jgi:exopolysaccharide production protein ExoQ
MSPSLALTLWLILLLALLFFDPAKDSRTSLALWVPLIWIFIVASRLPSLWIGRPVLTSMQAIEEGNPIDRTVYSVLIVLAMIILLSRGFKWAEFLARNLALIGFLSFALMSVLWSDFPFVALKRWFHDLGNYLVILVVVSDPCPLEALRTVLRRLGYVLISLSVLLVKYYPAIGKSYDPWTGLDMYVGATTSKNMLGAACLVTGLFFFWDTVTRWSNRKERRTKRIIVVNFALISMTLWLLNLSNSATSRVCLVIGCLVILAAHSRMLRRNPALLKVLIPAGFCLYLVLAFLFGLNGNLAETVGRNPTLTDRTLIWKIVLGMHTNPLVGTGDQSFWLGPRLQSVWQTFPGIYEAHNGYLDTYLNLGLIGLFFLGAFLIASFRTICKRITSSLALASFSLAVWAVILFYNMTEAAFEGGLLWMILLPGAISIAERADHPVPSAPLNNSGTTRLHDFPSFPEKRLVCIK